MKAALLGGSDTAGRYAFGLSNTTYHIKDVQDDVGDACVPMGKADSILRSASVSQKSSASAEYEGSTVGQPVRELMLGETVEYFGDETAKAVMTQLHAEADGCGKPIKFYGGRSYPQGITKLPAPTGTSDDCVAMVQTESFGSDGKLAKNLYVIARVGGTLIFFYSESPFVTPPEVGVVATVDAELVTEAADKARAAGIGV